MFNVFSNYLSPLIEAKLIILKEQTMQELFDQLCIAYNQGIKGIEQCIRLFVPNPEQDEELAEYIYSNSELMRIIKWTNQHILVRISKTEQTTIGVHLRIICSMLVKLKERKLITEEKYSILHSNLTKNVWDIYFGIINEQLPF